ncbi:MAG: hypothetical protein FJW64_16480 [Actinobacteria bacterium]|nr:hypothetical protein [Actinomycetota bacterium]
MSSLDYVDALMQRLASRPSLTDVVYETETTPTKVVGPHVIVFPRPVEHISTRHGGGYHGHVFVVAANAVGRTLGEAIYMHDELTTALLSAPLEVEGRNVGRFTVDVDTTRVDRSADPAVVFIPSLWRCTSEPAGATVRTGFGTGPFGLAPYGT